MKSPASRSRVLFDGFDGQVWPLRPWTASGRPSISWICALGSQCHVDLGQALIDGPGETLVSVRVWWVEVYRIYILYIYREREIKIDR